MDMILNVMMNYRWFFAHLIQRDSRENYVGYQIWYLNILRKWQQQIFQEVSII